MDWRDCCGGESRLAARWKWKSERTTTDDAQLLLEWLIRKYGDPSKGAARAVISNIGDHQHCHDERSGKPKPRRDNNRQQDQSTGTAD
jgi:hypothetical protein